ncbi:hypothetical protein AKJ41_03415 [candidate division MSBL1 archaeon SCGC-AAA259O05]|uniref:Metanogen output domain-containing protein n=1 Tax=candidate division MSBL1 archaeon SCGC-AAA259O05 TaxID=1698271 RepID=A0A133V3D2_9EURY|nr:hypothetical protein AKJ41_03415 [candidate division MSBL1 archaeon SCGC-AAA259O05]
MLKKISELVGEEISDRVSKKFEDLEEALEHLYWWEEGSSVEETGDVITSRGICPIYERYSDWCEDGCVSFAEEIAEEYGYSVERAKKRPDDEVCEFQFEKRD